MRKLIVKEWVDLLDEEEVGELIKYYRSLGKGDNQVRLLQYLATQAPGQALQAKEVSQALEMTPTNVRQTGRRLREEIEEWLLRHELKQRPMLRQQLLTQALQSRGGLELAAKEGAKWHEAVASAAADMGQLEQMHRHLEWQQHHHATQVKAPRHSSLPALHRQFDLYGVTFRIKTFCAMAAHPDATVRQAAQQDATRTQLPYTLQSLLDREAHQPEERRLPASSRALLQAYLLAYELFFDAREEQMLPWWNLIRQQSFTWGTDEQQNLYRLFQVYVTRRFNQTGADPWVQRCLDAYHWGFSQGLETVDHHVPAMPLFNYFNLCLRAGDHAQAQSLIEQYVPWLRAAERDHYSRYMPMLLAFLQKDYDQAYQLTREPFKLKPDHDWDAQLIRLQCQWTWEVWENPQQDRRTGTLKNLLNLKEKVEAGLQAHNVARHPIQTRIAYFETFLRLIPRPQELPAFHQKLSQSPTYLGKDWLMEQIETLID